MGRTRNASGQFVKAGTPADAPATGSTPADDTARSTGDELEAGAGVAFTFTDPITGRVLDGRGVVVDTDGEHVLVAPVAAFTVRVPREQVG